MFSNSQKQLLTVGFNKQEDVLHFLGNSFRRELICVSLIFHGKQEIHFSKALCECKKSERKLKTFNF